jgi:exopolysaccharide biosynthesis polyprenyl glycosylphosphotransferase
VGSAGSAAEMARKFERESSLGYQVVGVCTPGYSGAPNTLTKVGDRAILAMGNESDVMEAVRAVGADTVAVTAGDQITAARMHELVWELSENNVELAVSPGVVDVALPRLVIRPVAGLPLVHVEEPQHKKANKIGKAIFDRLGAVVLLLLLAPVLLAVAAAVKFGSKGPIFYKAGRVGAYGREFGMIKFRSMVVDADVQVLTLMNQNDGAGVLFKMKDDPRVTPVGKLLRRYSLDELPQLINVLKGEMSLVGPRPPLAREVAQYTGLVDKRLLVRPGMTGLWQVSGRSDLPWDEAVRLDLSYVENWTLMQDLMICWRTFKAVVAKEGAY